MAPGAFLIWIGAAVLIVGVVEFVWPLELTAQLFLFAALVVVLVVVGRRVYGSLDKRSPAQPLGRAEVSSERNSSSISRSCAASAISASTTASGG